MRTVIIERLVLRGVDPAEVGSLRRSLEREVARAVASGGHAAPGVEPIDPPSSPGFARQLGVRVAAEIARASGGRGA